MRFAAGLREARDLSVLTNGPDTFDALRDRTGVTPLLTGGRLEPRTGSLVGPLACWTVAQFAAQYFVTSAAALDPVSRRARGQHRGSRREARDGERAEHVVLAADSSKLGRRALAVGLEWDRVDLLVTELRPDDARLAPYRDVVEIL